MSVELAAQPSRGLLGVRGSYSDVILAFGVIAIIALMVFPLHSNVIDVLVAVNISIGVGLLLIAIYIPSPVAFSSFPSVLLITTLFRLSLGIATARLILMDANAGHIIDTFGKLVVGGNMIVGIVVFIIITVVQFIVVAKGAERVAEVAARFTLDAMPGKQLSIDSDLRSGLIEKDEAKRRRKLLEVESQLHGSLDGAMKFVKGDAIAGIVIIIVNLLGGLGVGILQRDMGFVEAMQTYSILTIGDGLVTQIPALLASIAAGLIVTRTPSEGEPTHLGQAIGGQIIAQPRVLLIAGLIAFIMMLVPGFPKLVFLFLGTFLVSAGLLLLPQVDSPLHRALNRLGRTPAGPLGGVRTSPAPQLEFSIVAPVLIEIASSAESRFPAGRLEAELDGARARIYQELGLMTPAALVHFTADLADNDYRISLFEVPTATGQIRPGHALVKDPSNTEPSETLPAIPGSNRFDEPSTGWIAVEQLDQMDPSVILARDEAAFVARHVTAVLRRHAGQFLGIQEVNFLLGRMGQEYPELIKELMRALPLQKIADVLRRVVDEGVCIRNLRDIFESLAEAGQREKDVALLAEYVRIGLKRHLSVVHAAGDATLRVLLFHPDLEEKFRQSVRTHSGGSHLAIDPELAAQVISELRTHLGTTGRSPATPPVLLTSVEIRRYVRKLIEGELYGLSVMSYQELSPDVRVQPVAQINA